MPEYVKWLSPYVYETAEYKSRVVKNDIDWFSIESKDATAEQWIGGLCGTAKWLGLTEDDKKYTLDKTTKKKK